MRGSDFCWEEILVTNDLEYRRIEFYLNTPDISCNICDLKHDPSEDLLLKTENPNNYGERGQI